VQQANWSRAYLLPNESHEVEEEEWVVVREGEEGVREGGRDLQK
jgi:hypothetical protein